MNIKEISINFIIFKKLTIVYNLNLKMNIHYKVMSNGINRTTILITYNFDLFEGTAIQFGKIEAIYEFIIEENYKFILYNEDTEQRVIQYCLKENGQNIRKSIIKILHDNEIDILENQSYLIN